MSFKPRWTASRGLLACAALATAAMLVLSACSSGSEEQPDQAQQQSQQQSQEQAQEQTAAAAQQSDQQDSATTTATDSSSGAANRQTSAAADQQQEQAQSAAQTDQSQRQAQDDDEAQQSAQQDDGASEAASPAMSVAIVEEAAYDDLSPRLQLLRDSGYPVYVSGDYIVALGTPDISPGTHRVSVVIEGPSGLVEFPAISVTVLPESAPGEAQEVLARFSRFPDGVRGFHVTAIDFARAGRWNLILQIPAEAGFDHVGLALDVPEDTSAPSVGDAAPASASRTLLDVPNIADLSTGETPDPGLYLVSVADAVEAGKPFVVVFASPGFCTNAFCGPQAEVLSEVRELFGDAANYIHIDLFENPEQVRLGEEPVETPILEEWGLHTDEWTFVVNADGLVTARFEAFAPVAEVEAALAEVLEG